RESLEAAICGLPELLKHFFVIPKTRKTHRAHKCPRNVELAVGLNGPLKLRRCRHGLIDLKGGEISHIDDHLCEEQAEVYEHGDDKHAREHFLVPIFGIA